MLARTVPAAAPPRPARLVRTLLMGAILATAFLLAPTASGQTLYVAPTGSDAGTCTVGTPCKTIGRAVDVASGGETISVAAGTYAESVVVDKSVAIRGARAGVSTSSRVAGQVTTESILDASSFGVGFDVRSSNVTIDGFDIKGGSSTWSGVWMFGPWDSVTIQYSFIHGMRNANPNSNYFSYSYGISGQGGGSAGSRGDLEDIDIKFNEIYDLGGASVFNGTSGGAGVFLFSLKGNNTGTGALISGNTFRDMADGAHTLWPQPGLAVAVLQDDDTGASDSGALITSNTYADLFLGVALQTSASKVVEASTSFSGVSVFVSNIDGLGQVDEVALGSFNTRDDEHQIAMPSIGLGATSYYPVGQTRYVNTNTGSDSFNLCTEMASPCKTIGWAMDRAFDGDVVSVAAGTYAEAVVLDKSVDLKGAKAGVGVSSRTAGALSESIIDASGHARAIDVQASGVQIDGFDIRGNTATWAGISMFGTYDDVDIRNNFIHGFSNSNPNSTYYSYTSGIYGQGGGSPGNRGSLSGLQIVNNRIYALGGAAVFNGVSGGSGIALFSLTGGTAGAGAVINGNRFEDLPDGSHSTFGAQPGVGIAITQDDEPATIDGGALIYSNTYKNVAVGVALEAANTDVTEAHASFTGTRVFVINGASRSTIDEVTLAPFAYTTAPVMGLYTAPANSVAYFASAQDAFNNSGASGVVTLNGNLSGTGTATSTRAFLNTGQLVITQNGVEIFRGSPSAVSGIIIIGTSGADTFEIDAALSGLLPPGGIQFHGGAGDDSLSMTGTAPVNSVTHTHYNEHDGTIHVNLSLLVDYTGLDPITDHLVAANRVFSFAAGSDTVTLGDNASTADGYSFIDSDASESVTFRNPTATMVINLGAGDDVITMNEMDSTFPTGILVTVNGDTGSDRFNVTPSVRYNVKVNGGDPTVAPGDKLDIALVGTTGANLSNLGGDGNWTFTNRKTVFFTGIETQLDDPTLADVSVTKIGSTKAYPGDVLVYRVTLANAGVATASGIEVTDVLPAQFTCVCAAVATEGSVSYSGGPGGSVVWSGIGLASGETATLRYSVTVASTAVSGSAVNTASITASSPGDADISNNSSSVTVSFERPIRFPTNAVVQAITFYKNGAGVTETLMGTHNQGLYRNVPGFIGSRWAPVLGTLPANLFVNDLFVSSSGTVYMATAHWGGLMTSVDGGRSWEPVDFGGPTLTTVYAVSESPVDGTIYISADDGQVWRLVAGAFWDFAGRLPGGASHTPWTLAADPAVAGRVYAGTFGDGVYRSNDYGETWAKVSGLLLPHEGSIHVFDLEFDPELSPTTLWAGTSVGVFFSQDGGVTWTDASTGLGNFKEVRSIAFGPVDPSPTATGSMYLATWGGGVFELPSNRATLPSWNPVALRFQQVSVVAVSPDGSELVAAPSTGGMFSMPLASTSTDQEATTELPEVVQLNQNYPNPFNPRTTITFALPEAGRATVTVHDLVGRQIAVLSDGVLAAGQHEVAFDAGGLPSGPYVYRLRTEHGSVDRMMMLLK